MTTSTTAQQPLPSGFDATTTTDDVLKGVDLTGRLALVTGGYSGIGIETTRALVDAGAEVIVPARRVETALEQLAGLDRVAVDALDLGDLESVRTFAERFLATNRTLDILVDSAGIMAAPETRVGPGWESQLATNHLGHFALVNRLWPAIEPDGARVVSVSSRGHHFSPIRWDDPHFQQGYDKWLAYGQSKTANSLFAVQLDALGRDSGVRAFAVHPGAILTGLVRHMSMAEQVEAGYLDEQGNLIDPRFKSPEAGAATQVWAATSQQLDDRGGLYLEDVDIAAPWTEDQVYTGVKDWAIDEGEAERLWTWSAELTGVDAFA
ncbi:SDR family NAD(P)-dependent oxidoreductase [Aeromicrobium ginsengisoli]|uniref:Probable oxidoreductase n=1 Tax=Aeromicrobium ginsengisoli TaxID=363867 RepID=A0A5M4FHF5_9ACTN|nr:SDR family NAD(P)-dependent oxidoreductase [Aeromicrobium ginsengisoli]KAA1399557.1 SDR family NAD(P)-dependent oxidoreductase [Aeromicrobium ginsengisoli]